MIRVLIKKRKGNFEEIQILGHAMYDDYGKDIVCAGASTIFITTVNAILRFNKKAINVEEKKRFRLYASLTIEWNYYYSFR